MSGPERVLVTGASGFVGQHLLRHLLASGVDVHAVSRSARTEPGVAWHCLDMRDTDAVWRLIGELSPSVIYHLSGRVTGSRAPAEIVPTLEANLLGAVAVLRGAVEHGCRRLVLTGSMEELGAGAGPGSPYAAAKLAASGYARMFHNAYGLSVVNLRLFMVYGPGQTNTAQLVPYTITSLLADTAPELSSGGRPVDWVYVGDVIDALSAAAAAPNGDDGRPIDIGSGTLRTIRETVEEIARRVGSNARPRFGVRPDRPHEATAAADLSLARRCLGWEPRTPFSEGLDATIAWYAARTARGASWATARGAARACSEARSGRGR